MWLSVWHLASSLSGRSASSSEPRLYGAGYVTADCSLPVHGSNKRQYYGQRLRMEPAGNVSEGLKTKAEAVKIISSLSCSIVLQLRKLAKGTKYAYKTCYPDWRTSKSTSKLRENLKKKK
ncbi:hypothetical protein M514_00383 [Trichuris suis]|uniref:Uncharacterized protein n=1 Tax=Trichuris suis TaxID=68888 RepID=A0A085NR76_9BILA|nr:hypothetical protein M514_00383 [Trichuris suis]